MAETIAKFWGVIVSVAVALIWLVRLEASVNATRKAQTDMEERLEKQRHEDQDRARRSEDQILAEIKNLRRDIQEAMRR